jgi:glycosyltransferase involved in cell wall biosynthesis
MRILIINYSEIKSPGGVHKTIRELAKNLSIRGHDVIILQTNPKNLPHEELYDGYKIIRINSIMSKYFYGLSFTTYFYIINHIYEINPDIIHVHGYHTLFSSEIVYLVKNRGYPIIFSPHLDSDRSTLAGKYLWNIYNMLFGRWIFKHVDHIVVFSNFEVSMIKSIFNLVTNKISIIPHGVNSINILKHNTSNNSKIVLLYSGYLIDRKNVGSIIECLHELIYNYKFTNIILKINGEGPDKSKLLSLADKLNVNSYISWSNFLATENFFKTLSEANIFILLSKSEAFGITVAEALSLGTPCIVTNVTALMEFNNETGCYTVEYPPNPNKVAKLIIEILDKNIQVGPLSNRIRVWENVANDYEQLYLNLIRD